MESWVQKRVQQIKEEGFIAQLLEYPIDRNPQTITTDASPTGIGASLTKHMEPKIEILHILADLWIEVNANTQHLDGNNSQLFILRYILKSVFFINTFLQ